MRALFLALAVSALVGCARGPAAETVVIVVRHAEKSTSDPKDPDLSEAGQARAQALAGVLAGAKVDAIYATQFRRTQQTAAPLAAKLGLAVQARPIDIDKPASYPAELAEHLRSLDGKTILVVGHSNTVPDIVAALTGIKVPPIADTEYGRLYIVRMAAEGPARLIAASY